MTIHVVRSGDTVTSIAAQYGVDACRLAADNGVGAGGALAVGQTLVIRFPETVHVIRPGETLFSLAAAYGTTVRRLWQNNWPLGGGTDLRPGETLVISYFAQPTRSALFSGYAYPYIDQALLSSELPYLSYLAPFTYGITADGTLLPLADDALLSAARQRGVRPVMHLSTLTEDGQFDTARGTLVLTDETVQTQLITQILQTLRWRGYAGLDVDFEYLPGDLAGAYAQFLARLRRLLHSQGFFLWAALAPKTSARQTGLLYEGHDYAAVGAAVDGVLLMTYEWGYIAGPHPSGGRRAAQTCDRFWIMPSPPFLPQSSFWAFPTTAMTGRCPLSRDRPAPSPFPTSGPFSWRWSIGWIFSTIQPPKRPFFYYTDLAGTVHEVWFEDARSLAAKLELIAEYGLMGGGFWNLMRPFSQTWLTTASLYNIAD